MANEVFDQLEQVAGNGGENGENPADAVENNLFAEAFAMPAEALFKKIQAPPIPTEAVIGYKIGESAELPGGATITNLKDGSQRVGITIPGIKTPGPHESVTVAPDGSISTQSIRGGNFNLRQEGDRQYITTPGGDTVVVQGNRVVKTVTGGHSTEILTPKQAAQREADRVNEKERAIEKELKQSCRSIGEALNNGNIPRQAIRDLYQSALHGGYGANGVQRVTDMLNALTNEGSRKPLYNFDAQTDKLGQLNVSVSDRMSGDQTNMTLTPLEKQLHFKKKWAS